METPAPTKTKAQIRADPLVRAIWRISEAALAPDRWPAALESITEAVGATGANYLFVSKRTGDVEWISSAGLGIDVDDYNNYYAARDPYRPILDAALRGSWIQVSKCLAETFLRGDEWYNDFLLKVGIRDVAGARLFETASHTVIFGLMYGIYQAPPSAVGAVRLQELFEHLSNAARLHAELRELGWKSAAAVRALDQLARGVIITDGHGEVTEVNRAAEQILRRDDGLTVRQGKLCAERLFEHDKLARFIALAADGKAGAAVRQMLAGRRVVGCRMC